MKEENRVENINNINPTDNNILQDNIMNNPQDTVNILESTTSNVGNNDERIIINETSLVESAKDTVVLANINNGISTPTNVSLPEPINIKEQTKTVNLKDGKVKKVKIITPRERITNIFITIIFIIGILTLGYGTYYFLYRNNPKNFNALNITLELGDSIPNRSSYYIDLKNVSDLDYVLDISNVENKVGIYNYSVRYQDIIKRATITIKDTKGPVINLKDNLTFELNTNITKEMLVSSCEDLSNCQYEINKNIKTDTTGDYTVTLIAQDDIGNITTLEVPVKIINPSIKLTCYKDNLSTNLYTYSAEVIMTYKEDKTLVSLVKNIKGKFSFFGDYLNFKNQYLNNSSYIFYDDLQEFSSSEELNKINDLDNYDSIINYYLNNGYTCN